MKVKPFIEKLQHYNITVFGKVQGVGYRNFILQHAKDFGIVGYAKNTHLGTVFIEAEGEQEILLRFVTRCKAGPGWARVEKVEFNTAPIQGFNDFTIKN